MLFNILSPIVSILIGSTVAVFWASCDVWFDASVFLRRNVTLESSHGALHYRPSQRGCDFCILTWEALFNVLNILNIVILVDEIICEDLMKITQYHIILFFISMKLYNDYDNT